PANVPACTPSIVRVTDFTPLAVHFSSIIVGALHYTGEGGLIVKLVNTTPGLTVVLVDGPAVVVVTAGAVVAVVEVDVDDEAVEVVVAGGTSALSLPLQAERARRATRSAGTGAELRTNGGYDRLR